MKKLFIKDPKKRIGHNGAKEIKEHPWFKKINWENINNKKVKAPFIPVLNSETALTYFDEEFTSESLGSIKGGSAKDGSPLDTDKFQDFSYGDEKEE